MKQNFIKWFTRNNNGCAPAMAADGSFESEKTQHMYEAYQVGVSESEVRCAALAAENAATNNRMQQLIQIINNADNDYCMCGDEMKNHAHGSCGHPTGMFDYHYNKWLEASNQAPATSAFLAEVRARGADECVRQLVISDDDDFSDAPNVCAMVAHQLRQGGAA